MLTMFFIAVSFYAQQPKGISYEEAKNAPSMQWVCPEISKYQNLINSLRDDDCLVYANNIKEKIEPVTSPSSPNEKLLVTQAILTINNPLFHTENLLNYIEAWIKKNKGWENTKIEVDKVNKKITIVTATVHVASHAAFLDTYKVSILPSLVILLEDDKLIISFATKIYKNDEYNKDNKFVRTYYANISEVYPFVPKSSYKKTYAKAYVGAYQYFWDFISRLCNDLNTNFSRDSKMQTPDINKELRFYEEAQKFVFMGKTINFEDVVSCEIVDDPKFIPGRSTTLGAGISFFGFGFGGAETHRTPDKTIHNYVVDVKIDNMGTPFIRIATGQNEHKATEIASTFEYILRHQESNKVNDTTKKVTIKRRKK